MKLPDYQNYERTCPRVDRFSSDRRSGGDLLKKLWTTNASDGIRYGPILNAILPINRTGGQWRELDSKYPSWGKVPRLGVIAADHGCRVSFVEHVEPQYGWEDEIAQKPESSHGFVPEKNRWPVERSFGWLNFRPVRRCGRLFQVVGRTAESSEATLRVAFIFIILNPSAK